MDGRQRLARLVEVLRAVPEHYNQAMLNRIARNPGESPEEWQDTLKRSGVDPDKQLPEFLNARIVCHTSACAGGEAAYDPELQAEGLRWKRKMSMDSLWGDLPAKQFSNYDYGEFYRLSYDTPNAPVREREHWGSVLGRFFELNDVQVGRIFGSTTPCSPTEKATQIEHFLKTGEILEIWICGGHDGR